MMTTSSGTFGVQSRQGSRTYTATCQRQLWAKEWRQKWAMLIPVAWLIQGVQSQQETDITLAQAKSILQSCYSTLTSLEQHGCCIFYVSWRYQPPASAYVERCFSSTLNLLWTSSMLSRDQLPTFNHHINHRDNLSNLAETMPCF